MGCCFSKEIKKNMEKNKLQSQVKFNEFIYNNI